MMKKRILMQEQAIHFLIYEDKKVTTTKSEPYELYYMKLEILEREEWQSSQFLKSWLPKYETDLKMGFPRFLS
jgi:hypothetical protein